MVKKKEDTTELDERRGYWNSYYSGKMPPSIPSQFAVFVLNEKPDARMIVDIGCGTGRDSLFFCKQGLSCVGVDGSTSAIEHCTKTASDHSISNAEFLRSDLRDTKLYSKLDSLLELRQVDGEIVIYARFLIHAISEEEEALLINLADSLLSKHRGYVALEFRTERDKLQPKATQTHFRRYVDPVHFFARVQNLGFEVEYFVEGFGFAKYKQDDAHVARFILKRAE